MSPRAKRHITADDLYRFKLIRGATISPDGAHVAYSLQRVDRRTEKRFANLWVVPTAGGRPRQFTYGDQSDTSPAWSPAGDEIAFLSNRGSEDQPQICVIRLDGGEARPVTNMKGDFGHFEWSPDGRFFVCSFRKTDPEDVAREKDEAAKKLGVVSQPISRMFFKEDGAGFIPKERWHLWTVDATRGRAKQITDGEAHDETDPRWVPDSSGIVFISNRAEDPDMEPEATGIFSVPVGGGELTEVPAPMGSKRSPSISPDGRWIAYLGTEGRGDWWRNTGLWVVPSDGKGAAKDLMAQHDVDVSAATMGDTSELAESPPTWSADGSRLYFQVTRHGSTTLKSISLDGDDLQPVTDIDGVAGSISVTRLGDGLAYFHAGMADTGQVWTTRLSDGQAKRLTDVNERFLRTMDLGDVEEVWFKGAADNDLQGWVLKPPGFDPAKRYPSVLQIHGGPLFQYGNSFMHEFYYLAAQGYVVYFCNPRGGQGYGEEHARAIWNDWGGADYDDLMSWADLIRERPYIDPSRMGVTGGSYGGYMTNWIIGHTDRFAAAVTQRSVSNLVDFVGTTDGNWIWQQAFGGKPPWEDLENYWRQSPIAHIANAKTPTLVIHSEQDLRCPIAQGEQLYVALKRLGVETEMVRFPGESHGLSRGGRTDRRIARLNHIVRWFDRYLKPQER